MTVEHVFQVHKKISTKIIDAENEHVLKTHAFIIIKNNNGSFIKL